MKATDILIRTWPGTTRNIIIPGLLTCRRTRLREAASVGAGRSGASRTQGSDRCSTTGTEAGPVPATKGGEPERGRSGVVLKAGKNGRRDRAPARSVDDE